ncbi:hypothetical protein B9G54_06115 [Alloscardovia macacae]|nr:hypothetical protein B9G54_06115 [Alloscardovia macacae]
MMFDGMERCVSYASAAPYLVVPYFLSTKSTLILVFFAPHHADILPRHSASFALAAKNAENPRHAFILR